MLDTKIHIIALLRDYPPATGGIQFVVKNLYENLSKQGFDITLVFDKKIKNKNIQFEFNPQAVIYCNLISPFTRKFGFRFFKFWFLFYNLQRTLKPHINHNQINILHAHWLQDGIYGGLLAKRLNVKSIWTCHNILVVNRLLKLNNKSKY